MKKRKSYIVQREAVLVSHSSIIEMPEFENLKYVLEKYKKVDEDILNKDDVITEKTKHIIRNEFQYIVHNASKEWKAIKEFDEGHARCMLDNRKNERIFFIKNKINGRTLNVGSTCILNFIGIENGITEEKLEDFIKKQQKAKLEVSRKMAFTNKYKNPPSTLAALKRKIEEAPLLLPEAPYIYLSSFYTEANNIYESFLKGKLPLSKIDRFGDCITEFNNFYLNNVEPWLIENADNPLICTYAGKQHLLTIGKEDVISLLRKNNSLISRETVTYFYYEEFFKTNIDTYRQATRSAFKNIDFSTSQLIVNFNLDSISAIDYRISLKEFFLLYGYTIFDNLPTYYQVNAEVYKKFSFCNNEENIDSLIYSIENIFGAIYEMLYDPEKYVMHLISKYKGKYCELPVSSFTNYFIRYIIRGRSHQIIENLYFNKLKWIALEELDTETTSDLYSLWAQLRKSKDSDYRFFANREKVDTLIFK